MSEPTANLVPLNILVQPALMERLDHAAARDQRSRSSMARKLLDGALPAERQQETR
jgi:predicted transcriptional regulator